MKIIRSVVALALLADTVGGAPAPAAATEFPDRPLRYIVPFPPGGSTDIMARIVAASLTDILGKQVVIDNRPGAGSTLGAAIAAQAAPDGYTLFACNIASLAVSPALYKKLGYNPDTDFTPIGLVGSNANSLVVHPSVPAKTVAEFISHAKSRAGKLNYSSPGIGTSPQLSMELFKMTARIDIVHIAYKGAGPAIADLMGGHVQAMFATVPSVIGATRAGKLRMLGVTSMTRVPELPDVPTIAESGMPGFEVISWQGLCTPAGVPKPVLARLRAGLAKVLALPDINRVLSEQGAQVGHMTVPQFEKFIRSERVKWAKVVKDAGIKPQ